ncbi:MAG: choline dehydrogenase [Solirubrobacteraceae bacterium]|jgi:hypothetical protein|nr:choline dehydrogenase [Solirubrobacteraceae bacterium]
MTSASAFNSEIHAAPALRERRREDVLMPKSGFRGGHLDVVQRPRAPSIRPVGRCAMVRSSTPSCASPSTSDPRVVDASVMPAITRGNTNASTIMVGEKGAEAIRCRALLLREQAAEEMGA